MERSTFVAIWCDPDSYHSQPMLKGVFPTMEAAKAYLYRDFLQNGERRPTWLIGWYIKEWLGPKELASWRADELQYP